MKKQTGWGSIPLVLKILFVLFILWTVGAIFNMPNIYKSGLPLMGVFIYGISAVSIVIILDILGPIIFLYALWNRKSWAPKWAFTYIGFFVMNGLIALFTVREKLGLMPILVPTTVSMIFILTIYAKRKHFKKIVIKNLNNFINFKL